MLTLNKNIDQKVNINIVNQEAASDTKFYYDKLLTDFGLSVINKPFDTELYEYKPVSDTINYFIYFLSFKDKDFNQNVINNIEPAFADYYELAKKTLKTVNKGNNFNFLQNNDNLAIRLPKDMFKTATQIALDKPYQITDFVQEVNKLTPINPGLPLFYDTFTFPFSEKINTWNDRPNKFSDLPALYNSFLLLDFYTSPNRSIQQKMLSLPIFVVDRYMMYEKSVNEIRQLRPTFLLKNGIEGYSIFFLQKFGINKLYIKYSFWDAMNGKRIPLLASSLNSTQKKGIQSVSKFDHRNEYIMVNLDYNTHNYKLFEFNQITQEYDIESYDFDLYELFYDDYWAGKLVKNNRPIALPEPTTYIVNPNSDLPLTFNRNKVNFSETASTSFPTNSEVQSYFDNFVDNINPYIIEYFRNRHTRLPTKKGSLKISENILYVDNDGNEIKSKSYQKKIDPIIITNNGEAKIKLYDIFLTNLSLTHSPLYNNKNNNIGTTELKNQYITKTILSKKKLNNDKLIVENYLTYNDLGLINQTHNILSEFQNSFGDRFKSPYNSSKAGANNIIENLDFDKNNPKSLATYLRNKYINASKSDIVNFVSNYPSLFVGSKFLLSISLSLIIGELVDIWRREWSDDAKGYYNIISLLSDVDKNINKLKFKNLFITDRIKFLDSVLNYSKDDVNKKLADEILYQNTPLRQYDRSDIESILQNIRDNNTAAKNIEIVFNKNNQTIYMRDLMTGLYVNSNTYNKYVEQNEKINIDINIHMGQQFINHAYNQTNDLYLNCKMKVLIMDELSNRKIYDIPITYKLI